jgi:hypothetical protein
MLPPPDVSQASENERTDNANSPTLQCLAIPPIKLGHGVARPDPPVDSGDTACDTIVSCVASLLTS